MGEEGEGTGREESHCTSLLDLLTTQLTQIYVYNYIDMRTEIVSVCVKIYIYLLYDVYYMYITFHYITLHHVALRCVALDTLFTFTYVQYINHEFIGHYTYISYSFPHTRNHVYPQTNGFPLNQVAK